MYNVTLNWQYPILITSDNPNVSAATITQEVNTPGSFTFTLWPEHPYFTAITKLKSYIQVYEDGTLIWQGRVMDDELGLYGSKSIYCEGAMGYLSDSIQRNYDYAGTLRGLVEYLVDQHNAQVDAEKQLVVGTVTVTDDNDYVSYASTAYNDTLTNLKEKLVDTHGGYLNVRQTDGVNYLDYLSDFDARSEQEIRLGSNLLEFARTSSGLEVATCLIPRGATSEIDTGEYDESGNPITEERRLDITGVNGGRDYITASDEVIAQWGYIWRVHDWDDVTQPDNLLRKAVAYLDELSRLTVTIELSAVDLSSIGQSIDPFHFQEYVKVISDFHGYNEYLLVKAQTLNLLDPSQKTITLGETVATLTDATNKAEAAIPGKLEVVESITKDYTLGQVNKVANTLSSLIQQSAEAIRTEVSSTYATPSEVDQMISNSTSVTQNASQIELLFNQYSQLKTDTAVQFTDISKYIRFVDGSIILGITDCPLTLKITNDQIEFWNGSMLITYWNGNELISPDTIRVPIGGKLQLGNYAFVPRNNGNLSFKWIGGGT